MCTSVRVYKPACVCVHGCVLASVLASVLAGALAGVLASMLANMLASVLSSVLANMLAGMLVIMLAGVHASCWIRHVCEHRTTQTSMPRKPLNANHKHESRYHAPGTPQCGATTDVGKKRPEYSIARRVRERGVGFT